MLNYKEYFARNLECIYNTNGNYPIRIAPIHFQVTEVTFRARLRLLRPASFISCEIISTLYLLALPVTAKLPSSSFGIRAYLPERSVNSVYSVSSLRISLFQSTLLSCLFGVVQFCSRNLGLIASCLTTQS